MSSDSDVRKAGLNVRHKSCLVCGSAQLKRLDEYARHYLVRCGQCAFVFCEPIPSQEELQAYYKNYGAGQHETISPITIKRYEELLAEMEPYRVNNRILDVGCGSGHFLATAKAKGWEVYGTEYPESLCGVCRKRGITMHQGVLDPANYPEMEFDVVTSFEVIEHINNPREELGKFYRLLRKGGLVYCTTPNFNALQRLQLGEEFNILCYPEHLAYYSRPTLKKVFEASGFTAKKVISTGYSFSRAKPTSVAREKVTGAGSPDENAREKIESSTALRFAKEAVNAVLSVTGTGITLKGYFVKN